ncbi:MAG TPA: DUF5684 domain-containing protein [Candidatus Dormibacteraeota bacterium]|jgi:hypothetical protein|nr:DUF5684 domain-containing protein [Candidatus Dormibacteraeota bacterium]
MKLRGSVATWSRVSLMAVAALLLPIVASAQDDTPKALPAVLGAGFIGIFLIFCLAMYVYVALSLQTIAQKTNTENGWLAWIPIANIILMLNIGRKPIWWIVLFLIPFVGIVMYILAWMAIAEARNKPSWWGIMVIVPVMNLIMPGYLAWSD